jgi:hypothetical protein|tara:strand:- start:51 stop:422 length:372 start_codon:yes stop_codon:yes gene_type:complete
MDEQICKDIRLFINHNHRRLSDDYERIERVLDNDKINTIVRNAILNYLKKDQEIVLVDSEVDDVINFMFSKKDIRKYLENNTIDFPKHFTDYERAIDVIEGLLQGTSRDVSNMNAKIETYFNE